MDLTALTHLLVSVQTAAQGKRIILFGSSSLFGSFPNDDPHMIGVAVTQDADFFIEPDDASLRETLDEAFGEDQAYHAATGHFGDFVDLRLSNSFPEGWRSRLVPMPGFENIFALEPVDMAVTKVAATARSRLWRRLGKSSTDRGMKDIHTIVALLNAGRLDRAALSYRLQGMDYEPALIVECGRVMDEILATTKQ